MLDLLTCAIVSMVTACSLIIMAIGSKNRMRKLMKHQQTSLDDLKIVLVKPLSLHRYKPPWAHRSLALHQKLNQRQQTTHTVDYFASFLSMKKYFLPLYNARFFISLEYFCHLSEHEKNKSKKFQFQFCFYFSTRRKVAK